MTNEKEIRSRSLSDASFETRSVDGKNTISGYLVVWNRKTSIDSFDEICTSGMFDRTLRENPDVLLLRDHDSSLLLGRTGVNLTLTPDSKGLHFICTLLDDSQNAQQALVDVKNRLLTGCSFGFSVRKDSWTMQDNGTPLRKLLDVNLFEGSITSFPAYSSTSVNARSIKKAMLRDSELGSDDADSFDSTFCLCSCKPCSEERHAECSALTRCAKRSWLDDNCDCSDPDADDACGCDEDSERSRLLQRIVLRKQAIF